MMVKSTVADVFRPSEGVSAFIYDAVIVIFASLLVGLSAQIRIYLPFSPVPVTGQTFAVLILAALLGSRRGVLTILAYMAEGFLGLPIFAGGIGLAALLGPTGGYLVGFIATAYLVGRLAEMGWDRRVSTTIAMMVIGDAILLSFGFIWLSMLTDIRTAFVAGVYPFIIGDILKIALAAVVLPVGWKMLKRLNMKA